MSPFQPITIEDKARITAYLRADPPETSELTFTNLFMWRHRYRPAWTEVEGCLAVLMQPDDEPAFCLPPVGRGDKEAAVVRLLEQMADIGLGPVVERAPASLAGIFQAREDFRVEHTPDQDDYVYRTSNLIELGGRSLHQKKNHLNRFLKTYDFELQEIQGVIRDEVRSLQEAWCDVRQCALDPSLDNEDRAVREVLTNLERLDCRGMAILIDGRVQAFALGEPLTPDTAVIHVEKANPDFRGLYAAVNQMFCRDFWADFAFVNREQDLGVEGLRRAKRSYQPDHMVAKHIIRPGAATALS